MEDPLPERCTDERDQQPSLSVECDRSNAYSINTEFYGVSERINFKYAHLSRYMPVYSNVSQERWGGFSINLKLWRLLRFV
jgi:hypothetical protein